MKYDGASPVTTSSSGNPELLPGQLGDIYKTD